MVVEYFFLREEARGLNFLTGVVDGLDKNACKSSIHEHYSKLPLEVSKNEAKK
jgi:hypothetical protein